MAPGTIKRRNFLSASGFFLVGRGPEGDRAKSPARPISIVASASQPRPALPEFRAEAFSMVGVFDIDWLLDARFTSLLDNLAASPGAFRAVRFFGALNSGEKENVFPTTSGTIWPQPEAPMDFSTTLNALDHLVSRGLVPFVPLTFFPSAVSPSPVEPPASFEKWQRLVQAFLDQSVQRFGAAEVERWWLEVWNEPNMPPFWHGDFTRYLDLYRATSETVLRSGHTVRLGGPAIAYLPDEGANLIERFLLFLHREPAVRCDFISFHRKGIWAAGEDQPRLERSIAAARETARAALRIDAVRFRGMPVINNEADMKVGFDAPFEPRMTEQFPAWLMAQTIAYSQLDTEFATAGLRFWAASDNANQQLIRAPFDGRRSIMTRLGSADDLVKVPAYGFYELLRLLQPGHGAVRSQASVYPHSDLHHLTTMGADAIAAVFALYPDGGEPDGEMRRIEYRLRDVPWRRVNIATFCIDHALSNAFTAAGRLMPAGVIAPDAVQSIRWAQELAVLEPLQPDVAVVSGEVRAVFQMRGFSTVLVWVTPFSPAPPAAPRWLEAKSDGANVVLRWTPNSEPWFYSYELLRLGPVATPVAPTPLRAALWVDRPKPGRHVYQLRAVSASGIASEAVASPPVVVTV